MTQKGWIGGVQNFGALPEPEGQAFTKPPARMFRAYDALITEGPLPSREHQWCVTGSPADQAPSPATEVPSESH